MAIRTTTVCMFLFTPRACFVVPLWFTISSLLGVVVFAMSLHRMRVLIEEGWVDPFSNETRSSSWILWGTFPTRARVIPATISTRWTGDVCSARLCFVSLRFPIWAHVIFLAIFPRLLPASILFCLRSLCEPILWVLVFLMCSVVKVNSTSLLFSSFALLLCR